LFLQTRDNQIFQEGRDVVTVCEWTDRIYQNTQPEHIITNVVSGRKMRVQKYNFPDTVVWNPWQEKARDIPDFGDDEFPNMICVESGHVSSPVILLPGTAFEASQILQVLSFAIRQWHRDPRHQHIVDMDRNFNVLRSTSCIWIRAISIHVATILPMKVMSRTSRMRLN